MIQTRMPTYAPPPGASRLRRIRVVPGWVRSRRGRSCHLLLAHDPIEWRDDVGAVPRDMLGVAAGLGLVPSFLESRHMVHRGYLVDGTVVLDYGHEQLVLQGRVERWWYDLAAACGYIRLAVGLDPIPDDGGTDTATFMEASKLRGRLWTGITTLRIALPQGRR